jgi:hypothetical protein
VTTSRICLIVVPFESFQAGPKQDAEAGVLGEVLALGASESAGRFVPEISLIFLNLSAASQSNTGLTDVDVRGVLGEWRIEVETAGDTGSLILGNPDGPMGGADKGSVGPQREGFGRLVPLESALGLFMVEFVSSSSSFTLASSHSQLKSDAVVEGELIVSSSLSRAEGSSDSVDPRLSLLWLLEVVLTVLVRFSGGFAGSGGDARLGDASGTVLRKSR